MALPPEARAPKVKRKRAPKPKPAPAPNFPKAVPRRPGATTPSPPPTRRQVTNAKRQQQGYKRQAGAVRRAAQTQSILGPGVAVPHKKVQRRSDVKKVQRKKTTQSILQERRYVSQGRAVEKAANQQKAKRKKSKTDILFETDRKKLAKAGFAPSDIEKGLQKIGKVAFTSKAVKEGIPNIGREAIDIPANIVPTAAHLADPIIKNPTKPKSYVETAKRTGEAAISLPKELIKHPGKTLIEHPLSSALLVAPVPKVPVRGVRAVERRVPKAESHISTKIGKKVYKKRQAQKADPNTLWKQGPIYQFFHPYNPKTGKFEVKEKKSKSRSNVVELTGTRLKENRPVTTGYARNIKKRTFAKPSKTVTAKEVETRIDEDVALMEGLTRRESAKAAKKAYRFAKKDYQKKGYEKKLAKRLAGEDAAKFAQRLEQKIRREQTQRMVDTMGLTERPKYAITKDGLRLVQEGGDKARVYKTAKIAEQVAADARVGDVEFVPYPVKGGYSVIPKVAAERWKEHTDPTSFSPVEAISRMYSTQWRRNVLALHPTWYTGNVIEAALRAAVAGAGPASFYRGYKVPSTLKTMDPVAARELSGRVYGGGHLAMQANLPREYQLNVSGSGSLAKVIRSMQYARKDKPILKNTIDAWEGFSDFTMGTLSGGVEGFFQRGMLGKALSKDPIMDGHMIKVSKAAIEDAAKGLRETENQVKMGRIVDEMYGRYGKWSPGMRRAIANYTPFISWTMNALNFLYRTLPRDHPVLTAAAASVQPYVDEWRKDKGLNKFVKGAVPAFLQGAVPTKEGFARYPTRYTPFAVAAQFPEDIGDLFLPQYSSAIDLMRNGTNWKGQKVKNPDGTPIDPLQKLVLSSLYLLEGAIPASQQISGPAEKYEQGIRTPKKLATPKKTSEITKSFDPFRKIPPPKKKTLEKKKSLFEGSSTQPSLFDKPEGQKSLFGP